MTKPDGYMDEFGNTLDKDQPTDTEPLFAESTITETIDQRIEEFEGYIEDQPNETLKNKQIAIVNELRELKKEFKQKGGSE